jgi:septum formation protein
MKVPMKTKQINTGHIILASASPRRKELLDKAGLAFDVRPADIDEDAVPYAGDPAGYTRTLSTLKASAVAKACPDAWVIGADTIVVADNNILGKPKDRADAIGMLAGLAGRSHFVYTGFCIVHWTMGIKTASAVETQVEFKTLTDEEVAWYADTNEPYDKAGAYGIQGIGGFMVKKIQGSYSNVVGLPVCEILEVMTLLNMIRYQR